MVVLIIAALLSGFLGKTIFKKWSNPVSIHAFLWSVIFFLYALNLENYYVIPGRTQIIFFLQIAGFSAGGLLAYKYRFRLKTGTKNEVGNTKRELMFWVYIALSVISVIVLLGDTLQIIEGLMQGMTFDEMAMEDMITDTNNTGIRVFLKIFIMFPVAYSISAVTAAELLLKDDKKTYKQWLLFIFNLVIVILYSLQHGARIMLFIFVLTYVSALAISGRNIYTKGTKKLIWILCILAAVLSVVLSASRGIDLTELLMSIYHYFAACIPHFHVVITKIAADMEYTLGAASLNGFLSPIFILLKAAGLMSQTPYLNKLASNYIYLPEEASTIGQGVGMNAFVTSNYTFYVDGGMFGVLLGMFIYGYFVTNTYMLAKNEGDIKYKAVYLLLISTVLVGFIRFSFCRYHTALALVLCLLIYRKKREV